jgi:dynein heavy chain
MGIEQDMDKLVDMFKRIHKSVENISKAYLKELKRINYVTPKSFLE